MNEYAESKEFNKYKPHHRCFDNHVEQNGRTNISESDTTPILDSCYNGRRMHRRITDLNFKMVTSLLAGTYFLNFKKCIESTCRGTFWTQSGISNETF